MAIGTLTPPPILTLKNGKRKRNCSIISSVDTPPKAESSERKEDESLVHVCVYVKKRVTYG
jgi:hypothetical protein